jgi:hypothetical protein
MQDGRRAGRDGLGDGPDQERLADARRALDHDAGPGRRPPPHHGQHQILDGALHRDAIRRR